MGPYSSPVTLTGLWVDFSADSDGSDSGDINTATGLKLVDFRCSNMEDKYSSNVLSGGKLGMVEVPNSRYVSVDLPFLSSTLWELLLYAFWT